MRADFGELFIKKDEVTMILTIDIGNTSAKYAVMDEKGEILLFDHLSGSWKDAIARLLEKFGKDSIEKACISNVAGLQLELEGVLSKNGIESYWLTWDCEIARKWLKNIPEGYGADRVAADIGAVAACPDKPLLVVDAGTCITYDVISQEHACLGGSITPGIGLRLRAMHEHTAALPLFKPEGFAPVIGTNNEESMRGGCVNGVRWEIEGFARELSTQVPGLCLFYTGGVPLVFTPEIEKFAVHDPYLVLRGLWHAYKK